MKKTSFIFISILLTFFAKKTYCQYFFVGMNEENVKKEISQRAITNLTTSYNPDGSKTYGWKDVEFGSTIVVIFNDYGRVDSCAMVPFNSEKLHQWRTIFTANHEKKSNSLWIAYVKGKKYKIFFREFEVSRDVNNRMKFGFSISEIK